MNVWYQGKIFSTPVSSKIKTMNIFSDSGIKTRVSLCCNWCWRTKSLQFRWRRLCFTPIWVLLCPVLISNMGVLIPLMKWSIKRGIFYHQEMQIRRYAKIKGNCLRESWDEKENAGKHRIAYQTVWSCRVKDLIKANRIR